MKREINSQAEDRKGTQAAGQRGIKRDWKGVEGL